MTSQEIELVAEEDSDGSVDLEPLEEPSLFWSLKLEKGKEHLIEEPVISGFMIQITSASFGVQIESGTRTVVTLQSTENDEPVPICILSENTESTPLDLLINGLL